MKTVDRYILSSVLKTCCVAVLLSTAMLVSVKIFSRLDAFLRAEVPLLTILRLAFLSVPNSLIFVLAPCLMFSASLTFSQMAANNEVIILYNASFSRTRLVFPVLLLGLAASVFQFAFQEYVEVPAEQRRQTLQDETIGAQSTQDKRNVTLSDYEAGFVFHARRWDDRNQVALDPMVVLLDGEGMATGRITARTAAPLPSGRWVFSDADIIDVDGGSLSVSFRHEEEWSDARIDLDTDLLRDNSSDITTMRRDSAKLLLSRMEKLDQNAWRNYAVDYSQRILGCLAPFVMVFIACTISYRYKKNVLLFTIILSLCIAVVYYVIEMVTLILARQGVLSPVGGMVIPMIVVGCIAGLQRLLS